MASISPIWVKITDFGISKNYGGSALRTHCGTVVYQAPEILGLLPRKITGTAQSYTKNVDIWAFGAVIHEVLTSEIPFLEPAAIADTVMDSSTSTMSTVSVDMDVLYNYCRGRPFPTKTLEDHEICLDGINFVKSLMTANPMDRVSAPDALMHSWLGGNPSCVARFDQPLQRRHADGSGIMAPTEPAAKRTPPPLPPRNNSAPLLARPAVSPVSRSMYQLRSGEGQSRSQTGYPVIREPPPRPPMPLPIFVPAAVRAVTGAPVKPVVLIRSVPRVLYWRLRLMTGSRILGFTSQMELVS